MCLGPEKSGTSYIARAVLEQHDVQVNELCLSVGDMVDQIRQGKLDAGFFVSYVPSKGVQALLESNKVDSYPWNLTP